jgi:peptidyl-prolyl cis-trans isomerase A (cyclophilin A)
MIAMILSFALFACSFGGVWASETKSSGESPTVVLSTTLGDITIELNPDKAPITVENFLEYVDAHFYDGTIFHRAIPGFVIQGGGLTPEMKQKQNRPPIENEADNGLKNDRGTLSMARAQDVNSATSQFFINLADNTFLNHGVRGFGYAVFGRVTEGMDIVDKIAEAPTGNIGMHRDVPVEPVIIKSAYRK